VEICLGSIFMSDSSWSTLQLYVVELLADLLLIWDVSDSNLDLETGYPAWGFFVVVLISCIKMLECEISDSHGGEYDDSFVGSSAV
jgi:hypothetical protein